MIQSRRWRMTGKQQIGIEPFDFEDGNLGPRQLALQTEFTAISPGTECANYLAQDPDVNVPGKWCAYPWIPGYSGVAQVIATGSAVTEFRVGDRVLAGIQHAAHVLVSADDIVISAAPRLNPEHGSYIMLISIAMTALQVLRNDPLGTAAVWGLGTIGNLAAQLLHCAGYRTIGIDPVAERRESALACHIDVALDPTAADFTDRLRGLTNMGLDVAVDSTGHAPTTIGIPSFVRRLGQVVLLTHWREQPVADAGPFIHQVFVKGITVHGAHANSPASGPGGNHTSSQRYKWSRIQQQLVAGNLSIEPLISHRITPEQCHEAYEGLCFDRARWRGVVVDWRAG